MNDEEIAQEIIKTQNLLPVMTRRLFAKVLCRVSYRDGEAKNFFLDVDDRFIRDCFAIPRASPIDIGIKGGILTTQTSTGSFFAQMYTLNLLQNIVNFGASQTLVVVSFKNILSQLRLADCKMYGSVDTVDFTQDGIRARILRFRSKQSAVRDTLMFQQWRFTKQSLA